MPCSIESNGRQRLFRVTAFHVGGAGIEADQRYKITFGNGSHFLRSGMLMDPLQTRRRGWQLADRIGATASFLCAVHCALLPFVLALLPVIGLGFLADHRFERGFVLFAASLAAVVLFTGFRRHRRQLPLLLVLPGVALLVAGVCVDLDTDVVLHSVLVTCGGVMVAAAHLTNLRVSRRLHVHGPRCAH